LSEVSHSYLHEVHWLHDLDSRSRTRFIDCSRNWLEFQPCQSYDLDTLVTLLFSLKIHVRMNVVCLLTRFPLYCQLFCLFSAIYLNVAYEIHSKLSRSHWIFLYQHSINRRLYLDLFIWLCTAFNLDSIWSSVCHLSFNVLRLQ